MIIAATTLAGYRVAEGFADEYRQMLYLKQLIYMLQSEIRYTRAYLGEAFQYISGQAREPYKSWLLKMSVRMEQKDNGCLSSIWRTCTEQAFQEVRLPAAEKQRLAELGGQLGIADIEMQMKSLELYQEQLGLAMAEKREGMKNKRKLCHCLGVMSGIFITILLV